jgi:hypothetical protein
MKATQELDAKTTKELRRKEIDAIEAIEME